MANGSPGCFQDNNDKLSQAAAQLYEQGYRFTTTDPSVTSYPAYAPGCHIHTSEVMCFLIDHRARQEGSVLEGMSRTFMDYPAEIVGLALSVSSPDRIFAARISQPMMIGWGRDAAYLATTAMAFPQEVGGISSLPANAAAQVLAGQMSISPFDNPPAPLSRLIPWDGVFDSVERRLQEGEATMVDLLEATERHFLPREVDEQYYAVYEVLRTLRQRGQLAIAARETAGATPLLQRRTFYCRRIRA